MHRDNIGTPKVVATDKLRNDCFLGFFFLFVCTLLLDSSHRRLQGNCRGRLQALTKVYFECVKLGKTTRKVVTSESSNGRTRDEAEKAWSARHSSV